MQHFRKLRLDTRITHRGLAAAAVLVIAAVVLAAALPSLMGEGAVSSGSSPAVGRDSEPPSYIRDVAPILHRACVQCHGAQRADKGLRLDSYQRMMAGDTVGTVVIPGDSSLSAMISVVRHGAMPHDGTRLTAKEIETVSRWIDAGAPEN